MLALNLNKSLRSPIESENIQGEKNDRQQIHRPLPRRHIIDVHLLKHTTVAIAIGGVGSALHWIGTPDMLTTLIFVMDVAYVLRVVRDIDNT